MDSLNALERFPINPNDDRIAFDPAMNRHPVTVIDPTGSTSRCDAVLPAQVQGLKLAGMPAPVACAHDCGRESDDFNTSGEGPG